MQLDIQNASVEVVGDQLQVNGHAIPGVTCQQRGNRYLVQADGFELASPLQQDITRWTQLYLKTGAFASSQFGSG
jgi:hypothetical protein